VADLFTARLTLLEIMGGVALTSKHSGGRYLHITLTNLCGFHIILLCSIAMP